MSTKIIKNGAKAKVGIFYEKGILQDTQSISSYF